jgi:hypothetical protein
MPSFKPKTALRASMSDYRREAWLTNIPLYAVASLRGGLAGVFGNNSGNSSSEIMVTFACV